MHKTLLLSFLVVGLLFAGCDSNDPVVNSGTLSQADINTLAAALGCTAIANISAGQSLNGSLDNIDCTVPFPGDDSKVDYYGFRLSQGMSVTFNLESSDFDAFVAVFNSNGTVVDSDDDGGDGLDARLTVNLDAGLYAVAANTSTETPVFGSYTISRSN